MSLRANYNPDYNTIDDFMGGTANAVNILADDGTGYPDETAADGLTTGFQTKLIFSDDRSNAYMFHISPDAPVYRLARGPNSPVGSYVDITALDQYGNPVRGLSVNAISDRVTAGTSLSAFPFVQYFTTRSNGSYRVSYSYSGGPAVETLTAFGAIANQRYDSDGDGDTDTADALRLPNRDTTAGDRVLEAPALGGTTDEWALLLPGADEDAKPDEKVYWAYVGRQVTSPTGGFTYADAADTGLLAWDVPNKAFVVNHDGITDVTDGPHVYYWDEHDTFQVNAVAVSMGLFEDILAATSRTMMAVTLDNLSWTSYNYNRPNDRAHWTLTCS